MKQTKILPNNWELGYCLSNGDRYINIQLIWDETLKDYTFIKRFSQILLHERLHSIIDDIVCSEDEPVFHDRIISQDKYRFGAEQVIRRLTNDSWTVKEQRDYK